MQLIPWFAIILVACNVIEGRVESIGSLPRDLTRAFDTYHSIGNLQQQSGELVFWNSIQEYLCKFAQSRPTMTTQEYRFLRDKVNEFMQPLYDEHVGRKRTKRQATPPRVRREIRMLSQAERDRYFVAVNELKNDRRLQPNIYDTLVSFHRGDNIARAHFGPAFPAWHRLYLWLYESFLRLYDPTVTIPFWASNLDDEMVDPTDSVIWTPAFFGNGVGEPTTRPFENWRSINPQTVFNRNIGNGQLFTYENIIAIVNRTRNSQILLPTADAVSNLELFHGGPHVFVGGSMNQLDEAVRDPIFFSHHAYVDQIWERFRFNQYFNGINPGTDYPFDENDPRFQSEHRPNETMGFFPNNQLNIDYRNAVGYSNIFFTLVQYERVPSCPSCGGSPYLYCNTRGRCASRSIAEMGGRGLTPASTGRTKRQASLPINTCSKPTLVNDFEDKRLWTPANSVPISQLGSEWIYVPVKIISKRSDEYNAFKQYSLDGFSSQSSSFAMKNKNLKKSSQYFNGYCQRNIDAVSKIKIVSYGLNYHGYAEEYALLDNRLGLAVSYGFVPVKKPGSKVSEAIVAAFDSCGRVCKPYCKTTGSSNMAFAGGVRVTRGRPYQYGNSYAEATLNAWQIPSEDACPSLDSGNIPLSFYCDYTEDWIWTTQSPAPSMKPSSSVGRQTSRSRIGGSGMRPTSSFPSQRGSRGRSTSSRGSSRRRSRTRGVSGVPFHGSSDLHVFVPDILKKYSLERKRGGLLASHWL